MWWDCSTGSLGILAEACAFSARSGGSRGNLCLPFVFSGNPPDERHTYGHGKIENLSALFETLLLLATSVWIIYEAHRPVVLQPHACRGPASGLFLVMIISIAIDYSRSRMLKQMADKYKSQGARSGCIAFLHGYMVINSCDWRIGADLRSREIPGIVVGAGGFDKRR